MEKNNKKGLYEVRTHFLEARNPDDFSTLLHHFTYLGQIYYPNRTDWEIDLIIKSFISNFFYQDNYEHISFFKYMINSISRNDPDIVKRIKYDRHFYKKINVNSITNNKDSLNTMASRYIYHILKVINKYDNKYDEVYCFLYDKIEKYINEHYSKDKNKYSTSHGLSNMFYSIHKVLDTKYKNFNLETEDGINSYINYIFKKKIQYLDNKFNSLKEVISELYKNELIKTMQFKDDYRYLDDNFIFPSFDFTELQNDFYRKVWFHIKKYMSGKSSINMHVYLDNYINHCIQLYIIHYKKYINRYANNGLLTLKSDITDEYHSKIEYLHDLNNGFYTMNFNLTNYENMIMEIEKSIPLKIQKILYLYASGMSYRDIGKIYGVSRTTIYNYMKMIRKILDENVAYMTLENPEEEVVKILLKILEKKKGYFESNN